MSKRLYELSIMAAARRLETGELTAQDLTRAFLERIAERNGDVHAYVAHDPALALAQARAVDEGRYGGLLKGIPYAVKDIIQTAEYPTTYGSPIYQDHLTGRDAACVALSREQGGVLLGKATTSEFATQTPGAARNPLRLAHTPGGSSSGSAAAVADGMAMAAWGTQTTGSITRPAVYCGIVGYKPSFGLISAAGTGVLSPMQDTVGVLARSVQDAALFALGSHGAAFHADAAPPAALRLGVVRSSQWAHATPETASAIERFIARASAAGVSVRELALPSAYERLITDQGRLVAYEGRQALAHERLTRPEALSPRLVARIKDGGGVDLFEFLEIQRRVAAARHAVRELFADVDALIYPATDGEAEQGLENSGSPRFGALWTLLHMPTVALPIADGPTGLPLGVQLVGPFGDDLRLLSIADAASRWSERGMG